MPATSDTALERAANLRQQLLEQEAKTEELRQEYWAALTMARDAGVTLGTIKAATGQDRATIVRQVNRYRERNQ